MPAFCGSCGAPHAPDARFCGRCGASAPAPLDGDATGRDVLQHGEAAGPADPSAPVAAPATWELVDRAPRRSPRGRVAVLAAAAVLTVGAGGAAVYASTLLGGGGTQPEDVLPAGAIGFLKVDFDPAAGQKLAAFRLAQKFPDSGVTDEGQLQDQVLRTLLEDDAEALADYEQHVAPWLGQRAGVAVLAPLASAPDEPTVVVAVQVTDPERAAAGLTALAAEQAEDDEDFVWSLTEDEEYALLSDQSEVLDAAKRSSTSLADDERFSTGMDALDGDQIAVGWLDVAAAWQAMPEEDRAEAVAEQPGLAPEGLVVVGASVGDDHVEVEGASVGLSAGDAPELEALLDNPVGRTGSGELISLLPADSIGAVSVTGLGEGLSTLYSSATTRLEDADIDVDVLADEYGLRLPDDLSAVFGEELAAGLGGDPASGAPQVEVNVRTDDGARAVELLEQARDEAAEAGGDTSGFEVEQVGGGYTATFSTGGTSGGPTLGEQELFRRTLPDVDSSGMTFYLDIDRLVEQVDAAEGGSSDDLSDQARRNLAPLEAVGYTAEVVDRGDATFRLRLTVE